MNKKANIFFLFLVLVSACQQAGHQVINDELITQTYNCANLEMWKKEVMPFDSVKINGILPVISTKSEVIKVFGSPSKTIKLHHKSDLLSSLVNNSDMPTERLYFGNTIYDILGSVAVLKTIDLEESNATLTFSKTIISAKTPSINLCKLFPESCKLMIKNNGNLISGTIQVKSSTSASYYNMIWFIYISGERISRVSFVDINQPVN
jgi:hypothetical protein